MKISTSKLAVAVLIAVFATGPQAQMSGLGAGVSAATAGAYFAGRMKAPASLSDSTTPPPDAIVASPHADSSKQPAAPQPVNVN
ncbi:hypothetical protein LGM65_28985 [Burkholderia anthina]|uniref:hypothetical protein n=1 Tax=Burkholderia anthina TaxID=179879 RepID=UPI001CF2245C|nr:hypothetical protein [Burkholderia anthina]MCA8094860.1 hypothetical protein [Burkholderia anthina]